MDSQRRLRRTIDVVLVFLLLLGGGLFLRSRLVGDGSSDRNGTAVDPAEVDARFPADRIIWQVEVAGVSFSDVAQAAARPSITVYGDGRAYLVQPAHNPQYDEPIPLRVGQVEPERLGVFVAEAEASGLFAPDLDVDATFGRPHLEEPQTTIVTLHGRNGRSRIEIVGLGPRFDQEVDEQQAEKRERLRGLLHDAEALYADAVVDDPERVRILHLDDAASYEEKPEVENVDEAPDWPGPSPNDLDAPAPDGVDAEVVIGCGESTGVAAVDLFDAAVENPTPHWLIDGAQDTVIVVMLLPDEAACG